MRATRFLRGCSSPFRLTACLALAAVCFPDGRTAVAVPPPMDEDELVEKSDIIATVRVLGVACTGVQTHTSQGPKGETIEADLGTYQAWLQLLDVEKGDVARYETLLVAWHEYPPIPGPVCVPYFPGEVVRTHLKKDRNTGPYRSTCHNAKGEPKHRRTRGLPQKEPGRVALARQPLDRRTRDRSQRLPLNSHSQVDNQERRPVENYSARPQPGQKEGPETQDARKPRSKGLPSREKPAAAAAESPIDDPLALLDGPVFKVSDQTKRRIRRRIQRTIPLTESELDRIGRAVERLAGARGQENRLRRVVQALINPNDELDIRRWRDRAEEFRRQASSKEPKITAAIDGKAVSTKRVPSGSPPSENRGWTTRFVPADADKKYISQLEGDYEALGRYTWASDDHDNILLARATSNADKNNGVVGGSIEAWQGSAWARGRLGASFSGVQTKTQINVRARVDYRGGVTKINDLYPGSTKEQWYDLLWEEWRKENITPPWGFKDVAIAVTLTIAGCVPGSPGNVADAISQIDTIRSAIEYHRSSENIGTQSTRWIEFQAIAAPPPETTYNIQVGLRTDGSSSPGTNEHTKAFVTGQIQYIDVEQEEWLKADFDFKVAPPGTKSSRGIPVTFTDRTKRCEARQDLVTWSWDFGDGTTGTGREPTHHYESRDEYEVTLTVTDDSGGKATATKLVNIGREPPKAAFDLSDAGEGEFQFTDESTDDDAAIVAWHWRFGDGAESHRQNPTHAYSEPGTYTVKLTVENEFGKTDTCRREVALAGPAADFTWEPSNPNTEDMVYFTDKSADGDGSVVSWSWQFGDGGTGSGEEPLHSYETGAPRDYTVTLTVTDDDGYTDSASKTIHVDVAGPSAEFRFEPENPGAGDEVDFTSESSGAGLTHEWDFGDGAGGEGWNLTHIYSDPGTYTVTLKVTDENGNEASISKDVEVGEEAAPPRADFSYTPMSPAPGEEVEFTKDTSGDIDQFTWHFGDGTTSHAKNPVHSFSEGTYQVTLTVSNSQGKSDTCSKTLTVSEGGSDPQHVQWRGAAKQAWAVFFEMPDDKSMQRAWARYLTGHQDELKNPARPTAEELRRLFSGFLRERAPEYQRLDGETTQGDWALFVVDALLEYLNIKDFGAFLYADRETVEGMRENPKQAEYLDLVVEKVQGQRRD